jgi:NAD(P)-dependent dehydrogenase (short-subunit alcohol dehydrogenase family)
VVVNNAGVAGRYGLIETSLEHWDRTSPSTSVASAIGVQRVAPLMRRSGGRHHQCEVDRDDRSLRRRLQRQQVGLCGLLKAAAMEFVD